MGYGRFLGLRIKLNRDAGDELELEIIKQWGMEVDMKILLIGASGAIGSRILKEAAERGHEVTAVARHIETINESSGVQAVQADAKDTINLIKLASGQDAIVSSMSPRGEHGKEQYLTAIESVLDTAKMCNTPYALFVGGTSNLITSNGRRILEQLLEKIPADQFMEPITVAEARVIIGRSKINWSFLCPGGTIEPGERTGKFRIGGENSFVDLGTPASISMEDYAVAVVDELKNPQHLRQVFNVCY